MNWEDEFKYLLNNKILSRSEFQELIEQIASVIYRKVSPFWAKVMELEKEVERLKREKNIEQGGWEECKKFQDEVIRLQKCFLTLSDMKDIMRDYINNDDDWNCDGLIERIYNVQAEKRE